METTHEAVYIIVYISYCLPMEVIYLQATGPVYEQPDWSLKDNK